MGNTLILKLILLVNKISEFYLYPFVLSTHQRSWCVCQVEYMRNLYASSLFLASSFEAHSASPRAVFSHQLWVTSSPHMSLYTSTSENTLEMYDISHRVREREKLLPALMGLNDAKQVKLKKDLFCEIQRQKSSNWIFDRRCFERDLSPKHAALQVISHIFLMQFVSVLTLCFDSKRN